MAGGRAKMIAAEIDGEDCGADQDGGGDHEPFG